MILKQLLKTNKYEKELDTSNFLVYHKNYPLSLDVLNLTKYLKDCLFPIW